MSDGEDGHDRGAFQQSDEHVAERWYGDADGLG